MAKRTMLFVRRFDGRVFGGHLKVFDYMRHVAASDAYAPALYVTPGSSPLGDDVVGSVIPRTTSLHDADAYFIAGLDWRVLDAAGISPTTKPVVNLIQGFAHVRSDNPRRSFLSRPALRVCVSEPLYDAVVETGLVNGPIACIENATDVAPSTRQKTPGAPVFIAGLKNPTVAREIEHLLNEHGIPVDTAVSALDRQTFLDRLRDAEIAVLLPHEDDGFFLPALEAMTLGCAVVVPRIAGIRSYCRDGETGLLPQYSAQPIADAALRLYHGPALRARLSEQAACAVVTHSLERERREFLKFLGEHT